MNTKTCEFEDGPSQEELENICNGNEGNTPMLLPEGLGLSVWTNTFWLVLKMRVLWHLHGGRSSHAHYHTTPPHFILGKSASSIELVLNFMHISRYIVKGHLP